MSIENSREYANYLDTQQLLLRELAEIDSDREIAAGITFKQPITQNELENLLDRYDIHYVFFEFEATQNVHGGYSIQVFNDLDRLESHLQDIVPNVEILGISYIIAIGKAGNLLQLNNEPYIILVDVGNISEFDRLNKEGDNIALLPAPSMYQIYKKFGEELIVERR